MLVALRNQVLRYEPEYPSVRSHSGGPIYNTKVGERVIIYDLGANKPLLRSAS